MTEKYKAINWNKIENRLDYSAWSRLNDFIWEPERVPVSNDKQEFDKLDASVKETFLKAFAALTLLSTVQVKTGNEAVKKDAATPQEYSVFTALTYLEAIANKGYGYVVGTLASPLHVNDYFDWAENNSALQAIIQKYLDIYENGTRWQKKIALSFMEMSIYHTGFYAPLFIFGNGELSRSTEIVKLAIRTTSFNAMYPGVKFRLEKDNLPEDEQKKIEPWLNNFVKEMTDIMDAFIKDFYKEVGWSEDALNYFHYTINKNFMNLGYPTPYPDDIMHSLSDVIQDGVIKSANFEDFFYYSNRNALTRLDNE